jgi:hypothetical protein
MHPNYYEAEWLTKFKLRESIGRTEQGYSSKRIKRQTRAKRVEARAIAPALRKSSSPC